MSASKIKKIVIIVLAGLVIMLGGGYGAYRGYVSMRQAKLIKQARQHLAKPNERKALLCLQRALRYNPKDVEACRLMAELTERMRSPSTLLWRTKVVELKPNSLDDRLDLARAAVAFMDYGAATNALAGVDAAGKKTAGYHNVAGTVAVSAGQIAQAEAHFMEASRLEPENLAPRINLAVIRLQSTNTVSLAEARNSLKAISANPANGALRCLALRELVVDALRYKQANTALALSKELVESTNSSFSDRILRLEVLQVNKSPELIPNLTAFQREASDNPARIAELASWQMAKSSPKDALSWLHSLPANTRTNQAVMLISAECYTAIGDWKGLQSELAKQNWLEMEFFRHAFLSRALRGQDLGGAAKAEWELAMKAANNQKGALVMLLRLVTSWRWDSEGEELLWAIVNRYPDEVWAVQALSQALYMNGRTRPLMILYSQIVKRSPNDLSAKNNLAMTAMLLDAQELKPFDLAREIFQKIPTNASFASTYAFSLHLQKKDAEALKVMQQLKPQELEHPSIAGYYGLILRATGDATKAKPYLQWAFKAPMLPEEKKLFGRAGAGA